MQKRYVKIYYLLTDLGTINIIKVLHACMLDCLAIEIQCEKDNNVFII